GQQEQARGFQRRCAQKNGFALGLVTLAGDAIEKRDAAGFAGGAVNRYLVDGGIGADSEVAGVAGGVDEAGGGIESGMDVAAAGPAATGAATETFTAVLVFDSVGGDARAVGCDQAAHLFERLAESHFGGGEAIGTLENTVGQVGKPFLQ